MLHIKGELKHILIMLVLLFLLGIICLLSELYLNISCRRLEQELEKAESPQDLDAFDEIFDRITDIWLLIMPGPFTAQPSKCVLMPPLRCIPSCAIIKSPPLCGESIFAKDIKSIVRYANASRRHESSPFLSVCPNS